MRHWPWQARHTFMYMYTLDSWPPPVDGVDWLRSAGNHIIGLALLQIAHNRVCPGCPQRREVWSCHLRSFGKEALRIEAVDASHKTSQPLLLRILRCTHLPDSPPEIPSCTGARAMPHTVYHSTYLCTNRGMAIGETTARPARPARPDPRHARHKRRHGGL